MRQHLMLRTHKLLASCAVAAASGVANRLKSSEVAKEPPASDVAHQNGRRRTSSDVAEGLLRALFKEGLTVSSGDHRGSPSLDTSAAACLQLSRLLESLLSKRNQNLKEAVMTAIQQVKTSTASAVPGGSIDDRIRQQPPLYLAALLGSCLYQWRAKSPSATVRQETDAEECMTAYRKLIVSCASLTQGSNPSLSASERMEELGWLFALSVPLLHSSPASPSGNDDHDARLLNQLVKRMTDCCCLDAPSPLTTRTQDRSSLLHSVRTTVALGKSLKPLMRRRPFDTVSSEIAILHMIRLVYGWTEYCKAGSVDPSPLGLAGAGREEDVSLWLSVTHQLEWFTCIVPSEYTAAEGSGAHKTPPSDLCHRTCHTSLNIRLNTLWESAVKWKKLSRASHHHIRHNSSNNHDRGWLASPALTRTLFSQLCELLQSMRLYTSSPSSTPSSIWMKTLARVIRVALNVEVAVSFKIYQEFCFAAAPPSLRSNSAAAPPNASLAPIMDDQKQRREVNDILYQCLTLRYLSCWAVHQAVLYWGQPHGEGSTAEKSCGNVWDDFFSSFHHSFASLLRRHYLFDAQEQSCLLGFPEASRYSSQIFILWNGTFIRQREANQLLSSGAAKTRMGRFIFSACGTHLWLALEVAFFLSVMLQRWPQCVSAAQSTITTHQIHTYVKEAFMTLEHATSKQLWHLRSTNALFYFTGETKDRQYVTGAVRERHAQSILSVVHAHVTHPSFLWMPLQQVEELFFVFTFFRDLFMTFAPPPTVEVVESGLGQRQELPPPQRRLSSVGAHETDFSLFHEYLMRRLFVVSNVLRELRRRWVEREDCKESVRGALLQLATLEPDGEPARREKRQWAKQTAADLMTREAERRAAEVEWAVFTKPHAPWGFVACLKRVEHTIQNASLSRLLYTVIPKTRQKAVNELPVERAALPMNAATEEDCDVLLITIHRLSTSQRLGFGLNAANAELTEVDEEERESGDLSPFAAAAKAAGVDDVVQECVGCRVIGIDDQPTQSGRDVAACIKGKRDFTMRLKRKPG